MKVFKINKENERIIEEQKQELQQLQIKLNNIEVSHSSAIKRELKAKEELHAKEKEVEKLRDLVRDQTDADLLVNALKAIGVIKAEKMDHKSEEERIQATRLMAGIHNRSVAPCSGQAGTGNMLGSIFGQSYPWRM